MLKSTLNKKEFGDFQTPIELAENVCQILIEKTIKPELIVEPTCGKGSFIRSCLKYFKHTSKIVGIEYNKNYVNEITQYLGKSTINNKVQIVHENFFSIDWSNFISSTDKPILFIGNPPWVTNSSLESMNSKNLPSKDNFLGYSGFDAISGKSNFDISEWILIKLIQRFANNNPIFAFLCKTATARKVLEFIWKNNIGVKESSIYLINAKEHFNAAVDACFLYIQFSRDCMNQECHIYQDINAKDHEKVIGYRDFQVISNINYYNQTKQYYGPMKSLWRSGLKHDCSSVMELKLVNGSLLNGFGEIVDIESQYLYPYVKSSDVAKDTFKWNDRFVIVTQSKVGESTDGIKQVAPKLWSYLESKKQYFENRKSLIYKNKPKYSIFGVGDYTFKPYKIAISALYKKLKFKLLSPVNNKPIIPDDTINFVGYNSIDEAKEVCELLNSEKATKFYSSYIFWDSKRPITISQLNKLDISKIINTKYRAESSQGKYTEGMLF